MGYCKHEMPAGTCGWCLGQVSPEEEAQDEGQVTGGVFGD